MKYFREESEEKITLSTYLKELDKEEDILRTRHLIELFGDIKLERSQIKVFLDFYTLFGGPYSVRQEDETLLSMLDIKSKYPDLSAKAIEQISFEYIKDLFEEYSLDELLNDLIDKHGKTDEVFEKYIELVKRVGKEYQKKYESDAKEVELLKDEYGERLVEYLQSQILHKHMHKEELLKYLPEKELIQNDEDQLVDFATRSRIHFAICRPMSYRLITEMTKDETLSDYPEEFKYYSSFGKEIPLTFTKSEFIESTKRKQMIK